MRQRPWCAMTAALMLLAHPATASGQDNAPVVQLDPRQWRSLGDLLRAVEPVYADADARRRAAAAIDEAGLRDALEWSGEAGFLIYVRLQADAETMTRTMPLGVPVALGVGADPFDAAAAGFFNPPQLTPAATGMRFAPQRSFFVWVSRSGGRLRFEWLRPEEGVRVRQNVDLLFADSVHRTKRAASRTLRIMAGIRARVARGRNAATRLEQIDAALAAYREAREPLTRAEERHAELSDLDRGTERALQLVELYRNILTIDGLRVQANATIRTVVRNELRRATTAAALATVLTAERSELRTRLAAIDLDGLRRAEGERYQAFLQRIAGSDEWEIIRTLLPPRDASKANLEAPASAAANLFHDVTAEAGHLPHDIAGDARGFGGAISRR